MTRKPIIKIYYAKDTKGSPDAPRVHVITKRGAVIRCHEARIRGPSIIIDGGPDTPKTGTRVWLETNGPVAIRIGDEWQELE